MAVVVVAGGLMVASGATELGVMIAFLFYIQRFFDPIRSLTMQYSVMQRAMASGHRLTEVLDVEVGVEDAPDAAPLGTEDDGSVEFRKVTFGYDPKHPVLKDVSFRVGSGETVALVGPSGAGKTTVIQLIQRFWDPVQGRVTLDGVDLRDMTRTDFREQMALVPQDPVIFAASAADNIRLGKPDASDAQVIAAAKAAHAHDFIVGLPQGYDTALGERGVMLSGGQRQRVAIARAILRDAPVLLLDEATSALDAITESQVQQALASLPCTRIVIAHRLSTVVDADLILMMDEGQLVEAGTHEELLLRHGAYAELVRAQIEKT
jgi:ATP-binding cassette subfamily B protein